MVTQLLQLMSTDSDICNGYGPKHITFYYCYHLWLVVIIITFYSTECNHRHFNLFCWFQQFGIDGCKWFISISLSLPFFCLDRSSLREDFAVVRTNLKFGNHAFST